VIDAITLLRAQEAGLPAAESHPDAPLVCFPLKIDWQMASAVQVISEAVGAAITASYPKPLIKINVPSMADNPAPVRGLFSYALMQGWSGEVTHSRGFVPHATHGTPGEKAKDVWAVRLWRNGQQARAVRHDGTWNCFWSWSKQPASLKQFKALAEFKAALA